MKQRMYNTFIRKIGNNIIAFVLANLGYSLLILFYMIARLFVKNTKNEYNYDQNSVKEAREKVLQACIKPDMR